jgi:hypothetical protein
VTEGKTGEEDGVYNTKDGTTNEERAEENTTQEGPTMPDQQHDQADAMEEDILMMEEPGQKGLKVRNGSTPTTSSGDDTQIKQPQNSTKRQKNDKSEGLSTGETPK